MAPSSMRVRVKCSAELLLRLRNHSSGMPAPTVWLSPVASAAPNTPHLNTAVNRKSSSMFVKPASRVAYSPSFGCSATIRKL